MRNFLPLMLGLAACNTLASAESPPTTNEPGANAIECSLHYRASYELLEGQSPDDPAFQFAEEAMTLEGNESGTISLENLTVEGNFASDEFEGAAFHLAVETGDVSLFRAIYQFEHGGVPLNQFHGDHGFTGLLYLTDPEQRGDYQLICKSVASSGG